MMIMALNIGFFRFIILLCFREVMGIHLLILI